MPLLTYAEQIRSHIEFLRRTGLCVDALVIDAGFIRCRSLQDISGRGEYVYKTTKSLLNNGTTGLTTWCRVPGGMELTHSTYGLAPNQDEIELAEIKQPPVSISKRDTALEDETVRKAQFFWEYSNVSGLSDYLIKKDVAAHGIRFRENQYGRVAVIPMRDQYGKLWSYQLLNPDGRKLFAKGAKTEGLFHILGTASDDRPIGIAESYVTSATCFELTAIPTACAFSCHNLKSVAMTMRAIFPNSSLIIFADNDKHLNRNEGLTQAQCAKNAVSDRSILVVPEFHDLEPSKANSDWNDLVRCFGKDEAIRQLRDGLRDFLDANISTDIILR